MLKIVGAVLIIAACSGIGFYESTELTKHEAVLKQLRQMVILLKGEIRYGNSSLSDILGTVSGKITGEWGRFLEEMCREIQCTQRIRFFEIFQKCAGDLKVYSRMSVSEQERFFEFGRQLGISDREVQIQQMELYEQELDQCMEALRTEIMTKKNMYQRLGVLGGIFLTVLIW